MLDSSAGVSRPLFRAFSSGLSERTCRARNFRQRLNSRKGGNPIKSLLAGPTRSCNASRGARGNLVANFRNPQLCCAAGSRSRGATDVPSGATTRAHKKPMDVIIKLRGLSLQTFWFLDAASVEDVDLPSFEATVRLRMIRDII